MNEIMSATGERGEIGEQSEVEQRRVGTKKWKCKGKRGKKWEFMNENTSATREFVKEDSVSALSFGLIQSAPRA